MLPTLRDAAAAFLRALERRPGLRRRRGLLHGEGGDPPPAAALGVPPRALLRPAGRGHRSLAHLRLGAAAAGRGDVLEGGLPQLLGQGLDLVLPDLLVLLHALLPVLQLLLLLLLVVGDAVGAGHCLAARTAVEQLQTGSSHAHTRLQVADLAMYQIFLD